MIMVTASICIAAPVEKVCAHLARLEDIQLWSEPVLGARCEAGKTYGVGAERTCDLAGNQVIRERWIAWQEGQSFTYEGFGLPMMRRAVNTWSVQPIADRTLLISEAELELKGGIFGRLLEPMVRLALQRMTANPLAGFKYLVEHGHPYAGKHAELPMTPTGC